MRVYGVHPVEELLAVAPEVVEAIHYDRRGVDRLREVLDEARALGITCWESESNQLDGLAKGGNHQGIVADTQGFEYAALDDLIRATEGRSQAGILVLDQVQDPRNLGAMIRSAAAMEFDGVVIPKDRAAGVTETVVRTSAGCAFRLPIARITNVARSLEQLKEAGYWAVGTRQEADPAWSVDFDMKTALVMGGEHEGMRRLVDETCDLHASIPMAPGIDSMNVASAASVMVYEVRRQWETAD
jgi:23S rRNA (guanosine2251-2'-O)-methyltransferase